MQLDGQKKLKNLVQEKYLLTSIDKDGTKDGYDIVLTKKIVDSVSIPVIASGGCGKPEDMVKFLKNLMLMLLCCLNFSL